MNYNMFFLVYLSFATHYSIHCLNIHDPDMSVSCHDIFEAANSHTNQLSNRGTTRGHLYPTTRHGTVEWCTGMLQKKLRFRMGRVEIGVTNN